MEMVGFEPTTIRVQGACSTVGTTPPLFLLGGGFEPPTPRFSVSCSNQLSYPSAGEKRIELLLTVLKTIVLPLNYPPNINTP